jgi:mediator of RNA polymerase II transcription subunit 24
MDKTTVLLEKISTNQFLLAVIYLGKHEDPDLMAKITIRMCDIDVLVKTSGFTQNAVAYDSLRKIVQVDTKQLEMTNFEAVNVEAITYCLQPFLAVNVLLNPSSETHVLVNEFLMIQRLKVSRQTISFIFFNSSFEPVLSQQGFSDPRLYCEIIRACFISLNNVCGTTRESMWCAFTFIKIPHILKQMNLQAKGRDQRLNFFRNALIFPLTFPRFR